VVEGVRGAIKLGEQDDRKISARMYNFVGFTLFSYGSPVATQRFAASSPSGASGIPACGRALRQAQYKRGQGLGAGKTRSQPAPPALQRTQCGASVEIAQGKMLENAADRASEPPASIAQPKRIGACHPTRQVHAVLARFLRVVGKMI